MFLAEWSGRQVAAYVLVWLVGFPMVVLFAASFAGMRGYAIPDDMPRHAAVDSAHMATGVMRRRPVPLRVVETTTVTRATALPAQGSDFAVGIDPGPDIPLLPWFLPPVLLVAAWGWTRRSRPEA